MSDVKVGQVWQHKNRRYRVTVREDGMEWVSVDRESGLLNEYVRVSTLVDDFVLLKDAP